MPNATLAYSIPALSARFVSLDSAVRAAHMWLTGTYAVIHNGVRIGFITVSELDETATFVASEVVS